MDKLILEEAKRIAQLSSTAPLEKKEEYLEQAQNILLEHLIGIADPISGELIPNTAVKGRKLHD